MPPAFSRVLLAYDGSPPSDVALHYACALARAGAHLAVATAPPTSRRSADGRFEAERQAAICRKARVIAANHGVDAEELGAASLDALAEGRNDARWDLIVAGADAGRFACSSDIPALIVTRYVRPPRRNVLFARALVAIGPFEPAPAALSIALRLSMGLGTRLTLCDIPSSHAQADRSRSDAPPAAFDGRPPEPATLRSRGRHMRAVATFLDDWIATGGDAVSAIEEATRDHNCDVVIIGRGSRPDDFTAQHVTQRSLIPVLVVPPKA